MNNLSTRENYRKKVAVQKSHVKTMEKKIRSRNRYFTDDEQKIDYVKLFKHYPEMIQYIGWDDEKDKNTRQAIN